jgi:hypothetical protein
MASIFYVKTGHTLPILRSSLSRIVASVTFSADAKVGSQRFSELVKGSYPTNIQDDSKQKFTKQVWNYYGVISRKPVAM